MNLIQQKDTHAQFEAHPKLFWELFTQGARETKATVDAGGCRVDLHQIHGGLGENL